MRRKIKEYPEFTLLPEGLDGEVDFTDIFGRTGPVHIEIGCGSATFLVHEGRSEPGVNFLGIERAGKYYRLAADRIGRWKLSNVRIIRTDAEDFITQHVPRVSVDCFHIYFPDPWPKRRHQRRRFFNPENFDQLLRCLKTGGVIKAATDHADYFEQMKEVIDARKDFVERTDFAPTAAAQAGEFAGTNYERKYLKDNKKVYTIAVRKVRDFTEATVSGQ